MLTVWKPVLGVAAVLALAQPMAAKPRPSGPTSEQIYCQNRAVNDYWAQVAACEASLGDLPSQLALCKSDAADDLRRRKAACVGQTTRAIEGATGPATRQPASRTQR